MLPVVFVSHSSSDNERARRLVSELQVGDQLATTFDVRDLRQGEAWRPQLYKWIARCHAGLLLVTRQVMQRPAWVLQEATLLRSRAMLEGPSFRLFIVIDREVQDDPTWTSWFAPLQLAEVQSFVLAQPDETTAGIAAQIRDAIVRMRADGDDYFSRLAALVRNALTPMNPWPEVGQALADGFRIDDADWRRIVGDARDVDRAIAQRLCQGDFGDFETVSGLFNELQDLCDRQLQRKLLGALSSYWVPLIVAARLADAVGRLGPYGVQRQPPPNVVLLQVDADKPAEVVDLHRHRQFAPYRRLGRLFDVPPSEGTRAFVQADIAHTLQRELFPNSRRADEVAAMLAELDTMRRRRKPEYTFLHIPSPATLAPVLEAARRFWPCVFIVSAPAAVHAEFAARLGQAEPALEPSPHDAAWHLDDLHRANALLAPQP